MTAGSAPRRAGLYARVSTAGQTPENQLAALRAFAAARAWCAVEFVDHGFSGARERRPALDALLAAARARKVDVVACVKLDRLARSVRHLVALVTEFEALGVDLVVLDQSIDTTTPTGRLLFHVLASIAQFERELIRERVIAGVRRAQAQGRKLGRPRVHHVDVGRARQLLAQGLSRRAVARALHVPPDRHRPGARRRCPIQILAAGRVVRVRAIEQATRATRAGKNDVVCSGGFGVAAD